MEQFNKDTIFKSWTYGKLTFEEVIKKIKEKTSDKDIVYSIDIGTDSQNHRQTKMVVVICVNRVGHGSFFFYKKFYFPRIKDLAQKIRTETRISIDCASTFVDLMLDNDMLFDVKIHLDIGEVGKTSSLIPEIVGWVTGSGFDYEIKPDSWAASCIADKISK